MRWRRLLFLAEAAVIALLIGWAMIGDPLTRLICWFGSA